MIGTVTRLDVALSGDGQAQLSQFIARDVNAVLTGRSSAAVIRRR